MAFDLMSYFRNAWNWAGGAQGKEGPRVDGGVTAGADTLAGKSTANDMLGGMVGGFGAPMDWKGAGFGAVANGKVTDQDGGFSGGHLGLGAGGGASTWKTADGLDGASVAGGVVAPVGVTAGDKNVQGTASTNVYTGAGASVYEHSKDGDHGYGAKASSVPLGLMDTNLGVTTDYGSAKAHADDMYYGKLSGEAKFGHKDGTYYGDVTGSQKMGASGLSAEVNSPLGTYKGSAGSVSYGPQVSGGGSYDTKSGAAELHGSYQDGLAVSKVDYGYSSPDGKVQSSSGVGSLTYGNSGEGKVNYDPEKGALTADGKARFGGVVAKDLYNQGSVDGLGKYKATVGEFSNDIRVDDAHAEIDRKHAKVGASVDGDGIRIKDANFDASVGSGALKTDVNAKAGFIGSGNSITKAYADANYESLDKASLKVGFEELSYGGWSGSDLQAGFKGPGGSYGEAKVGSFSQGLVAKGFEAGVDKNGLAAKLDHADYNALNVKGIDYKAGVGDYKTSGHLGELGTSKVVVDGATAGLTREKGLYATADSASYDAVSLTDLAVDQQLGDVYKSHASLGSGSFNHFSGKNMSVGANSDGAHAKMTDGEYRYLAGKDIKLSQSIGDGSVGYEAGAKEASLGGVDIGKLDYKTDFKNTHLGVENLGAHGWKSKDINAKANVGDLGLGAGAKELNALDLKIGEANLDTKNYGTSGSASMKDANLDLLNVKGGHAGLSWDGQEIVGAKGDYRSNFGVGDAKGDWDLMAGKASGQFKDASYGAQMSNASLNFFGTELAMPDAGFKLNASGGADIDATRGAANANFSLGGSSVNFAGQEMTVPDWVQAGAGVDASRGAANFNLGGQNGIGADMSIADGNLDLNAFGYTLDVDQGVRDVGNGIADGARAVGGGIATGARAVGGAISDGASAVWNALPSVSLPSLW